MKLAGRIPLRWPQGGGLSHRLVQGMRALLAQGAATLGEPAAVPERYRGVWRRSVLEAAGKADVTTRVHWLQTRHWHADLRLPLGRPDFAGVAGLQDCDSGQLAWLATQQGFAGMTEVRGARCQWRRQVDFQPDGGIPDIGQMAFNGERLIEIGVKTDYLEVWQRLPDGEGGTAALELVSDAGRPPARRTWLLVAGDWFAYVRARATALPGASSLAALIEARQPARAELLEWLDFEISFGQRSGPVPWRIAYSSLPFREGEVLNWPGGLRRHGRHLATEADSDRRWLILDWDLERL